MHRLLRAIKNQIRNRQGYSLTELLMVILILGLIAASIGGGVTAVRDAYEKVTLRANAETILSTTVTAMRDELAYAEKIDSGDNPAFYSGNSHTYIRYINSGNTDGIKIQYYTGSEEDHIESGEPVLLLSEKAMGGKLYTVFTDYTYDSSRKIFTVTGLKAIEKSTGKEILSIDDLSVSAING